MFGAFRFISLNGDFFVFTLVLYYLMEIKLSHILYG